MIYLKNVGKLQFLFYVNENGEIHHIHKFNHTSIDKIDEKWFKNKDFIKALNSVKDELK